MRRLLLMAFALISATAHGQGLRLGLAHHKAQRAKAKTKAASHAPASKPKKNVRIDEASDVRGDCLYRYVFAYNKNKERSSETIYRKQRTGTEWGEEQLYNKGIYTYEYDTQGRIVSKTVRYEKDDTSLSSYNVAVSYEDGYTAYTRCEISADGDYTEKERWSVYPSGLLRSYATTDDLSPSHDTYAMFDENGSCIECSRGRGYGSDDYYTRRTLQGTLNDSTITTYSNGYQGTRVEHYTYDPENGKLTEYKRWGQHIDSQKEEYVYDNLGRISAHRKYYGEGDGEDDDVAPDDLPAESTRAAAAGTGAQYALEEPTWRLEYNETYTYYNDEVYGIGNTWHDVFGMDGPLANRHSEDDDYKDGEPWVEDLTFNRDATGKLLSVVSTNTEDPETIEKNTIDVDGNGHITREHAYFRQEYEINGETTWYEDDVTIDFNWDRTDFGYGDAYDYDYVKTAEQKSTFKSIHGDGDASTDFFEYGYSPGSQFIVQRTYDSGTVEWAEVRPANKGLKIREGDNRFVQEVQTEDVSFVRPNLLKDYDGFYPDSLIVASVKGRVVACSTQSGYAERHNYGIDYFEWLGGDLPAYLNVDNDDGTYFSISHDSGLTICKDIYDLPIYVVQDGRLLKEYIYYDIISASPSEPRENVAARSVAIPEGQAYDEITYTYDTNGLVVGKAIKRTDENGTVTDEVAVEVKYDEASGIGLLHVSTGGSLRLSGRSLGLADGGAFGVFTLDGRTLAASATSYQFPTAGTYVVRVGATSLKVNIR